EPSVFTARFVEETAKTEANGWGATKRWARWSFYLYGGGSIWSTLVGRGQVCGRSLHRNLTPGERHRPMDRSWSTLVDDWSGGESAFDRMGTDDGMGGQDQGLSDTERSAGRRGPVTGRSH